MHHSGTTWCVHQPKNIQDRTGAMSVITLQYGIYPTDSGPNSETELVIATHAPFEQVVVCLMDSGPNSETELVIVTHAPFEHVLVCLIFGLVTYSVTLEFF